MYPSTDDVCAVTLSTLKYVGLLLSKMLIEGGFVYRDEKCTCMFVDICVSTMLFAKEKSGGESYMFAFTGSIISHFHEEN